MIQDRATCTTADQQQVIYDLSNGAIVNDLEWPTNQRHAITQHWMFQKQYKIEIQLQY